MQVAAAEPDVRPLGALALGAAALSAVLSVTYFLSPFAFLSTAVALPLALVARTHERSRGLGNAALVLSVLAVVAAGATLVLV